MINPTDTKLDTETATRVAEGRGFPARHLRRLNAQGSQLTLKQLECRSVARKCLRSDAVCLLHGKTGCGKTQLATWFGRQCAVHRRVARYWTLADLMNAQKNWFGDKRFDKPEAPFALARSCYLLVIDEVRANAGSLFDHNELNSIIEGRYRDMKATLLITNIRPEKMADAFAAHILDRLRDGGGVVELEGESMRGTV